jgi:chromosome segregation protein
MLRLEKIQISGFKSFSDRTEVRLPIGITAVVGPNGCGKSNIGDALNWVLGEQSPRMLRGKQMADVIFNGSRARKPLGMAEVSIHLGGSEGLPFDDQGRIVLTRRLFRSGDSEYLINGKRQRLKDFQELLDLARVGARSYATIEQGRIDQILNAKPRDRRQIIEDAAGIAGYKHKRRLTELKLEATHANLLRVNDIIVEVERQIRSLKRQAGKARRYRRLREELREKERIRFALRAAELDAELERVRQREGSARDAEAAAAAESSRTEAELVELREEVQERGEAFREGSQRAHELELEIDRGEAQIATCKERIAELTEAARRQDREAETLASRRSGHEQRARQQHDRTAEARRLLKELGERLESERAVLQELEGEQTSRRSSVEALRRRQFESMHRTGELRNRLRSAEEAVERARAQRERLEQERDTVHDDSTRLQSEASELVSRIERTRASVGELERAVADIDRELGQAREVQATESETLSTAREREQSAAARLATLEDVATRFAGVSDGVRALLSAGPESGLRTAGVVADYIEAGAEVESAAEGYLGAFLPAVIVEDDASLQRASDLLRAEGAGRTLLVSRAQPAGGLAIGTSANGSGGITAELLADPRVRGRLLDRIKLRSSANGVVQDRLGDAVLVEDLASALELHRQYPSADYLTAAGDVVYSSGVVATGGSGETDRGLLAHSRRMEQARREQREAALQVEAQQERVAEAVKRSTRLEVDQRRARQDLEDAQREIVRLEVAAERLDEDTQRSERRREVLAEELQGLGEERERSDREIRELREEVSRAEEAHAALERELELAVAAQDELGARLRGLAEGVAALRAEFAASDERRQALESEGRTLDEALAELDARVEALGAEAEENRRRADESQKLAHVTEQTLVGRLRLREELAAANAELERSIAESRERLAAHEQRLRSVRESLDRLREATREAELERTRAESARAHLDDLCVQELGFGGEQAIAEVGDAAGEHDADELEAGVAEIKARIERIGPVNMTAIEEFTELEERHGFLSAQRQDLEQSMTSLRETIRRINRNSRERFTEAFDAIRASFQQIFQLLFNGGRADLRLEEGEDVLECGIEIMAQPPGKRLGSVQLMSGGEKALSAIALLFAVFRFQPSPFCLLDEVDAALDDANVSRFARMLREYAEQTQFIVVTHNKLSMEASDLLYGVTMEEPGVSKLVSIRFE